MRTLLIPLLLVGTSLPGLAQLSTVRVEIDYMENATITYRPTQLEIDALVQMFACHGVNLILDVDDAIPMEPVVRCGSPLTQDFFTCTTSAQSFANIRSTWRDQGAGWHYCLFANVYDAGNGTSSSGIAELPGNDLLVAAGVLHGQPWTPYWRAATFAHELGHNLGLQHYSTNTTGSPGPFAPNLPSVMSYQYQLRGVKTQLECLGLVGSVHLFKDLDYSSGRMRILYEGLLSEPIGMGMHSVDWDCDGGIDTSLVSRDIDGGSNWCAGGSGSEILLDLDEWGALIDVASPPPGGTGTTPSYVTCATLDELLTDGVGCPTEYPQLEVESCRSEQMYFVAGNWTSNGTGIGSSPFRYLDYAQVFSQPGSVLYLQPSTIGSTNGLPIVLTKRLTLAGPGGAVVNP